MNRPTRWHLWRLGALTLGMFAFGFALGPLYSALCEAIGINGKMKLEVAAVEPLAVDTSRTVTLEFVTTVNGGREWKFRAEKPSIRLHPGEMVTVNFVAENTEGRDIIAQAVPNIAPWNAARHVRKTECFCFNQQPFKAGEVKTMPVRLMLDPALPKGISTVTLSYTFFDVTQTAQRAQGNTAEPS